MAIEPGTGQIRAYVGAGFFYQPDKAAVINIGSYQHDPDSILCTVRLPCFQFLQRFLQFVHNKIFGAGVGSRAENMKFVACNSRIFLFAEFSDFPNKAADLIVESDSLPDRLFRYINAVVLMHRLQNVVFALQNIKVQIVFIVFQRNFHVGIEKLFLPFVHGVQKLHVFRRAVDHRAAVRRNQSVYKIVAAFNRPLQKGAAVFAQEIRHVIGCDVRGICLRRRQTHSKCPVEVH